MVKATDDQNFQTDILDKSGLVLVDFWAEWCAPCKQLAPILEKISAKHGDKLEIFKVDIESSPEAPTKYEVRGIPNLVLFKDGKVVDTRVGALPENALTEWLEGHF